MQANRTSRTAQQNAFFRALEARRPCGEQICSDSLAVDFLPASFRLLAGVARIPAIRRVTEKLIDVRWPGPRAGQVVRTAYIDDLMTTELSEVEQVLILGAGLDSRAYRLESIERCRVFEIDHPSTQAWKRRVVVRTLGKEPDHVSFVAVDFGEDDMTTTLSDMGFRFGVRTVVLWEGVTNYLTANVVDDTLRRVTRLVAPGSLVVFTYIDVGVIDGSRVFTGAAESRRAVRKVGEPYTFGLDPGTVPDYLDERGLDLVRDQAVSELATRYFANGRRPPVYDYYHVVEARTR